MNRFRAKLIVAGGAFLLAAGLLTVAGLSEGWVYYLSVDQFTATADQNQRVRLHGVVGQDRFESSSAALLARFDMLGETHSLRVEYNGVIPDQFRPGHEVVVEGRLGEDGVFRADTLMTKCGSRYESDAENVGDAPHADPRARDRRKGVTE